MSYHELRLTDLMSPATVIDDGIPDVAQFLLIRGPHAFLGTIWNGCGPSFNGSMSDGKNQTYVRPAAFDVDYGVPFGLCSEVVGQAGLFRREWSKAEVEHDCNTGANKIVMK
jgi:hypothetical protein